ncbi:PD-(D/E)XK nuclease family protein [Bizionia sp.]|uniref:PD-(D/E)XK nuclease family protein n=1 Tax=Bizionia sp. TaxID=1954480 RepID=UPI003A8CEDD5
MIKFIEEKSFFEHLRIADSERVHSEFLSWVLSPSCNAISEKVKENLVINLFKLDEGTEIIKTGTEIDRIDIFIETNECILIIENKIKSSQHSNQLSKYKKSVELAHPNKKLRFVFLTLVREQNVDEGWFHVSYFDILNELNKLDLISNKHSVFIEDYILYLTRLLSVLDEVVSHPQNYSDVFRNGSQKKSDKFLLKFENKKKEFIAKNQLETIFQKAFLTTLLKDERLKYCYGHLIDTRGTALIDFPLKRDISIGTKKLYTTFIQIQGENIKFAFANQDNYIKSKKVWISSIVDIFKDFKTNNDFSFNKINSPKSKAYVSISKKMEKPYWEMNTDEIVSMIINEIQIGHILTENLMIEIKKGQHDKC